MEWVGDTIENAPQIDPEVPNDRRYLAVKLVKEDTERVWGIGDFVHVHSGDENPFIARIGALWEDAQGDKQVRLQWLYRPTEVTAAPSDAKPNEIFLTEHADTNPALTIESGVRIGFINPSSGVMALSSLYADPPNLDHSKITPVYQCSRMYNHLDGSITKLSPSQFEKLTKYNGPTLRSQSTAASAKSTYVGKQQSSSLLTELIPVSSLEHAVQCSNDQCQVPSCSSAKALINHRITCKATSCNLCKRYGEIVLIHAKNCHLPVRTCTIPHCETTKPSARIEHAAICNINPCNAPDCAPAKKFLHHVRGVCQAQTCAACSRFRELVKLHEAGCHGDCIYPNCPYFSQTLAHGEAKNLCKRGANCTQCWLFNKLLESHERACERPSGACRFPKCSGRLHTIKSSPFLGGVGKALEVVPSNNFVSEATPIKVADATKGSRKRGRPSGFDNSVSIQASPVMPMKPGVKFSSSSEVASLPRASRVGSAYQATIPPYIPHSSRPKSLTALDELVWSPRNSIGIAAIEQEKKRLLQQILEARGNIIPVSSNNAPHSAPKSNYFWARIVQPASGPNKDTKRVLRVVPFALTWPKDHHPASFLTRISESIFEVSSSDIICPSHLEEQALTSLYSTRHGSNKSPGILFNDWSVGEVLASWTESEYDTFLLALRDASKSLTAIAQACKKSPSEVVQFSFALISASTPLPAFSACSACQTRSGPMLCCARFFACGSCLCSRCYQNEKNSKRKDLIFGDNTDEPDFWKPPLVCSNCSSRSPPKPGATGGIGNDGEPQKNSLKRRRSSQDRAELIDTSQRGPAVSLVPNSRYQDNESIFQDYDKQIITAEQALDMIRDLLIAKSKKTLGILGA